MAAHVTEVNNIAVNGMHDPGIGHVLSDFGHAFADGVRGEAAALAGQQLVAEQGHAYASRGAMEGGWLLGKWFTNFVVQHVVGDAVPWTIDLLVGKSNPKTPPTAGLPNVERSIDVVRPKKSLSRRIKDSNTVRLSIKSQSNLQLTMRFFDQLRRFRKDVKKPTLPVLEPATAPSTPTEHVDQSDYLPEWISEEVYLWMITEDVQGSAPEDLEVRFVPGSGAMDHLLDAGEVDGRFIEPSFLPGTSEVPLEAALLEPTFVTGASNVAAGPSFIEPSFLPGTSSVPFESTPVTSDPTPRWVQDQESLELDMAIALSLQDL